MKRVLSLLLMCALLLALAAPVSATEELSVQPRFAYIHTTYLDFSINESTGVATCYANCTAASGVTIKIEGYLQQKINGGWIHVKNWTVTGSNVAVLNKQWGVYSGYQYRFYARFYIYDANGAFLESNFAAKVYDYT